MAQGEQRYGSIEAWRSAYGVVDASRPLREAFDLRTFRRLPVLKQLQTAEDMGRQESPGRIEAKENAIRKSLEVDSLIRSEFGIRPVVFLPSSMKNKTDFPTLMNYSVFVVYPHDGKNMFVDATRLNLASSAESEPEMIDARVINNAEIFTETPIDACMRYLKEIKHIDRKISHEKSRRIMARSGDEYSSRQGQYLHIRNRLDDESLNSSKHQRIVDYIDVATRLQGDMQGSPPMFEMAEGDDKIHKLITMRYPLQSNLIHRLIDSLVVAQLQNRYIEFTTNINSRILQEGKARHVAGSDSSEDRTAFELCLRLGI